MLLRQPDPELQDFGNGMTVVRDDLLEGGSKTRFLPFLCEGASELVFGGPFCGGAPYALSVLGRLSGQKVTLFYAARSELHPRQIAAKKNGARLHFVRPGYMTVVQKRARDYAEKAGALFLPLGFDRPEAEAPFVAAMENVKRRVGGADEVWLAAGSGMTARCASKAFPDAAIHAVAVGLASRHSAQEFGPNVTMHECEWKFEQQCKAEAPFPSCSNYDRKAWVVASRLRKGKAVFWNVMG